MFDISVIICSYNPRKKFLERTLDALKLQSLELKRWQLFLIDNNSENDLSLNFDLSWHPNAKHIKEEKQGLTHARLKGIEKANGKLLVFVDDDNVLNHDYLEAVIKIEKEYPFIGVFGGEILGEYEIEPPNWLLAHLSIIAVRDLSRSIWSNLYEWQTSPAGAGMVVRKEVANLYAKQSINNKLKQLLGRKGNNTFSGEDIDIVYTSIDMGLGSGRFIELKLTHLIQKERLERDYLLRLFEGMAASRIILNAMRGQSQFIPPTKNTKYYLKRIYLKLFNSNIENKIQSANMRGNMKAMSILKGMEHK